MNLPGSRCNAIIAALAISSLLLLAYGTELTVLSISELSPNLDGARILTQGILTSLKRYESGVEILHLVDESGRSTLKVVCAPSAAPPPSSRVSIGGGIMVEGELSFDENEFTLFTLYGAIEQISSSETALGLSTLQASWQLFEGDRFNMTGVIESDSAGAYRLYDEFHESSISLWPCEYLGALPSGQLVIDCTLIFDEDVFMLGLVVWGVLPVT